jgi:alkanesulfonate monooxygenase SsuD/methylene tetrahydromethanopterin reductase-like flavin-dependent oxidoreductase (luciferase family)
VRIGIINQLHGKPGPDQPTWESLQARVAAADTVGFDSFVFEDALLYRGESETSGCWESVSIAAALAAVTSRIMIGQSVVNNPYRSPALTAKIAATIDEISGGRYVLGIGAGNTPDSDYAAFGFPADKRYSRFAEAIQIIHSLLKTGEADFSGEYYTIDHAEMVLRGPRPEGPPINIAAGSPKMLGLVAAYADAWNWWGWDETHDEMLERMKPVIAMLERACSDVDRDPASLVRTYDLYAVIAPGFSGEGSGFDQPVAGSAADIAERILGLGEVGIEEVRCDVYPKTVEAITAMEPVVDIVHTG